MVVFGGYVCTKNYADFTNNVYSLNLHTMIWELLFDSYEQKKNKNVPEARSNSSAIISNNNLFIFGGSKNNRKMNDLWEFNLTTFFWTKIQIENNLPDTRHGHTMNIENNTIYLFGGFHDITYEKNDLYLLDLENKEWICVERCTSHSEVEKKNLDVSSVVKSPHNYLLAENTPESKKSIHSCRESTKPMVIQSKKSPKSQNINKNFFKFCINSPQKHYSKLTIDQVFSVHEKPKEESFMAMSPTKVQEKRQKIWQHKKNEMLNNFEINDKEKKKLRAKLTSPTTDAMKNSIKSMGDLTKSKSTLTNIRSSLSGTEKQINKWETPKKPCQRNGHTSNIYEDKLIGN